MYLAYIYRDQVGQFKQWDKNPTTVSKTGIFQKNMGYLIIMFLFIH